MKPTEQKPSRQDSLRDVVALNIADLSQFAKTLRKGLRTKADVPSHSELLSLVAKAAGYRNYQHLRNDNPPAPKVDRKRVARARRYFDARGLWQSWPEKRGIRELCCWIIWTRIPARQSFCEREISAIIDEHTGFRDAAQIRRALVEMGLMTRKADGTGYRRQERPLPSEARALLNLLADDLAAPGPDHHSWG